ncbi:MAG: flippase [Muribaculaceae bacterium]|nr:flippase [Muribaculaceae bacterium]
MGSIRNNIIYKAILIFSNYIFGFITFPYITRVLGPANFGLVNFALSVTDYFLLFATMGIATVGTREVAACRNNKSQLSIHFSRILGINLKFTIIVTSIYLGCIFFVPRFHESFNLFLVGLAKIIFSVFSIEWLFSGLENFRYITIRSFVIRLIYVVSVFLFVKTSSDYFLYFVLTIASVVVNAIVNFSYSKKFVKVLWKELKGHHYFRENLQLGFYMIMTSMYITFNVMYLGFVCDDVEVGYYSAAVKLYFIAVNLFSAFTSVMIPRLSSMIAENDWEKGKNYINKSYPIVFFYSFPIVILGIIFTPEIITIISGSSFERAITPMRILMVALFFVCLAQVVVFQGLIPLRKDKCLTIASFIGGVLALVLNIVLTPHFGSIGSAIVLLGSETTLTFYYLWIVNRNKYFPLPSIKIIMKGVVWALPYLCIALVSGALLKGNVSFFVATLFSLLYFLFLYKKHLILK